MYDLSAVLQRIIDAGNYGIVIGIAIGLVWTALKGRGPMHR